MSTFYAFKHTDCIYESVAATMSLHATKAGAYRAMRTFTQEAWIKQRSRVDTGLHLGKGFWREHAAADPLRFTASFIESVEVAQ